MATVVDVAAHVLEQSGPMDAWRLQKLAYYSQAWCLSWTGRPMFGDPIEAWADGPVAPTLRDSVLGRGGRRPPLQGGGDPRALNTYQRAVVGKVLNFYGDMPREAIINLTHDEDPWIRAYHSPGKNTLISAESMLVFYTKKTAEQPDAVPTPPSISPPPISSSDEEILERAALLARRWEKTLARLAS